MNGEARLAGKVALITGGASGIGLGMARAFAQLDMRLVLADRDDAMLAEAAEELRQAGAEVLPVCLDVRDRAGWASLADQVEARLGGVWLLCNNAGVGWFDRLEAVSGETWDWLMGINLTGVFNGVHAMLPQMIARRQGGHIVNTASGVGLGVMPGRENGAYFVSKAAVIALSEKLREELAEHDIGVTALCPGVVESRLHDSSAKSHPSPVDGREGHYPRVGQPGVIGPDEMALKVIEGILENRPYVITYPPIRSRLEERYAALIAEFDRAAG